MEIKRITPDSPLWQSFVEMLHRANDARWVLDKYGQRKNDGEKLLAAVEDGQVVGHMSLTPQDITIPATEWSDNETHPLVGPGGEVLREAHVGVFYVDEPCRRRGIGTALQREAIAWARELGCYQMRSWSSLDRPANYALKLGMGFAAAPAIYETDSGQKISGVYFVMKL